MNCELGDLAIRVRAPEFAHVPVGAIVRCIAFLPGIGTVFSKDGSYRIVENIWAVDWNGIRFCNSGGVLAIPDFDLRPIRDRGDDAQDETLNWLPVPSRDEVAA